MLGSGKTSDISLSTPLPVFFSRTSWLKRVETVWYQWLSQPCPQCWVNLPRLIGHYAWLELCATTWIGPQSWLFVSFKKGFDKNISPATISSWIMQTVILSYELSDQDCRLRPMMSGPMMPLRPSDRIFTPYNSYC